MNSTLAASWGKWLADYLSSQRRNNPFLLAANLGWCVVMENESRGDALLPARFAEWDGRERRIRLFLPILRRYLGNSKHVLYRACAHELFHGLVAINYRGLGLSSKGIPRLNYREEEIAAQVFSAALFNSQLEERL